MPAPVSWAGLGFRVQGSGFGFWGLGVRVRVEYLIRWLLRCQRKLTWSSLTHSGFKDKYFMQVNLKKLAQQQPYHRWPPHLRV